MEPTSRPANGSPAKIRENARQMADTADGSSDAAIQFLRLSLTPASAFNNAEVAIASGARKVSDSAPRHNQAACGDALAGISTAHARTRKAQPATAAGIVTLKSQNRHSGEGAKVANAIRLTGLAYQKHPQ